MATSTLLKHKSKLSRSLSDVNKRCNLLIIAEEESFECGELQNLIHRLRFTARMKAGSFTRDLIFNKILKNDQLRLDLFPFFARTENHFEG